MSLTTPEIRVAEPPCNPQTITERGADPSIEQRVHQIRSGNGSGITKYADPLGLAAAFEDPPVDDSDVYTGGRKGWGHQKTSDRNTELV